MEDDGDDDVEQDGDQVLWAIVVVHCLTVCGVKRIWSASPGMRCYKTPQGKKMETTVYSQVVLICCSLSQKEASAQASCLTSTLGLWEAPMGRA